MENNQSNPMWSHCYCSAGTEKCAAYYRAGEATGCSSSRFTRFKFGDGTYDVENTSYWNISDQSFV